MSQTPDIIKIATILTAPVPDDPATVALPPGASVDDYYMAWLRQNLNQARGAIDGTRMAHGLPQMSREEWALELVKFEATLAALPATHAENALRAFRTYMRFSSQPCPIQPKNINP